LVVVGVKIKAVGNLALQSGHRRNSLVDFTSSSCICMWCHSSCTSSFRVGVLDQWMW